MKKRFVEPNKNNNKQNNKPNKNQQKTAIEDNKQ